MSTTAYYLQLCDEHHVPVLILTTRESEGYEEQICETRFWQLDTARDYICLNLFDIGETAHATDHVAVLVDILNDLHPLSDAAQNLLHIVIWQTLLATPKACFRCLQSVLARYSHQGSTYHELSHLLASLPSNLSGSSYDNVSRRGLSRTPTIITARAIDQGELTVNALLLELLTDSSRGLPALFLVNPLPLNKPLFHWLCAAYVEAGAPLVLFDSYGGTSAEEANRARNFIFTSPRDASHRPLCNELTEEELRYLQASRDQVAVKLRDEDATRFVTIF
jgi:hypothetical protein